MDFGKNVGFGFGIHHMSKSSGLTWAIEHIVACWSNLMI